MKAGFPAAGFMMLPADRNIKIFPGLDIPDYIAVKILINGPDIKAGMGMLEVNIHMQFPANIQELITSGRGKNICTPIPHCPRVK